MDAEKYKAMLADPPGELGNDEFMTHPGKNGNVAINNVNLCDQSILQKIKDIGTGMSDDDFFHLTCHVDGNLINKKEKGEFVELDKLLPRDKRRKGDDNRME